MKPIAIRGAQYLVGPFVALIIVVPAQASLVFSFALDADQTGVSENATNPGNALGVGLYNPTGGNSVTVPVTGGTYYVDVVLTSDKPSVTRLGFMAGYYGAISSVLNGNLGSSTLTGNVTFNDLNNNEYWGADAADGGQIGSIQDNNADNRADFGGVTGGRSYVSPSDPKPWWARPVSGPSPKLSNTSGAVAQQETGSLGNAAQLVVGYFQVVISPYNNTTSAGAFLSYAPSLGPNDPPLQVTKYSWAENGIAPGQVFHGNFSTAPGDQSVLAGAGVTFNALGVVPEPQTLVLLSIAGVEMIAYGWRRALRLSRKNARARSSQSR